MHLLSSEEMVYETLTQITLRRSKQHLPPPWGEMGGRKARSYPQILVKNLIFLAVMSPILPPSARLQCLSSCIVIAAAPRRPVAHVVTRLEAADWFYIRG